MPPQIKCHTRYVMMRCAGPTYTVKFQERELPVRKCASGGRTNTLLPHHTIDHTVQWFKEVDVPRARVHFRRSAGTTLPRCTAAQPTKTMMAMVLDGFV
eukprot:scaffold3946_cov177-Amphora_coffeaeformis.AAC.26